MMCNTLIELGRIIFGDDGSRCGIVSDKKITRPCVGPIAVQLERLEDQSFLPKISPLRTLS